MVTVTANDSIQDWLAKLHQWTEIHGVDGQLVGYFLPAGASDEVGKLYAEAAVNLDPEEMQRRAKNPGRTYTTAEDFEHLQSLEMR